MKKILDLEATDFPNVDTGKFQEWKIAQANFKKLNNIAGLIMGVGIIQLLIFREQLLPAIIFGITVFVGIAIMIPPYRKVKAAQKESGLASKDIRKALRK